MGTTHPASYAYDDLSRRSMVSLADKLRFGLRAR